MKTKVKLLVTLMMLCFYSCHHGADDKNPLVERLKTSSEFKAYLKSTLHLADGIKNGRYHYRTRNIAYIDNNGGNSLNVLSQDQLANIYTNADMTDTHDYVQTQFALRSELSDLLKAFPELEQMDAMSRIKFLRRAYLAE